MRQGVGQLNDDIPSDDFHMSEDAFRGYPPPGQSEAAQAQRADVLGVPFEEPEPRPG